MGLTDRTVRHRINRTGALIQIELEQYLEILKNMHCNSLINWILIHCNKDYKF